MAQTPIVTPSGNILPLNALADLEESRNSNSVRRVDVRPGKGMMKIVAKNDWEAQIDATTGDILQVAYRRSDIIESIHDGSWFADFAKLWIFLPVALLLFVMWMSGGVLLYTTLKSKFKKRSTRHSRTEIS